MTSNHPNTLATLHFEANPYNEEPEPELTLGTVLHNVKLHSPRFFALVKKANLANYYNDSATSCTLFIPSLDDDDFISRDTEVEVCKMHTVNGKLRLDWLLMNPNVQIPTLSTQTLEVTTGTGPGPINVYINDAEIKYGDIECTNGIIHVLI